MSTTPKDTLIALGVQIQTVIDTYDNDSTINYKAIKSMLEGAKRFTDMQVQMLTRKEQIDAINNTTPNTNNPS